MGVRQFNLGKKHGLEGIRHMAHRKLRRYDSAHAQESYNNGYYEGTKVRLAIGKKLDYSNPLNNQLFMETM
jgi:hypothetical protein